MKFSLSKYYIFWILAVCLLVFAVIEIVEAKKPTPTPEEPLELYDKNIITTTPIGEVMRVWGYVSPDPVYGYEDIWTKEGERYKAVALGDIDGLPGRELCAASVNYVCEGRGRQRKCDYRIVVDVYREGLPGVQLSSPEVHDRSCVICELVLADVDGDSVDEIILTTDRNLVVFKYDDLKNEIVELDSKSDFLADLDKDYWIWSMAVADIFPENEPNQQNEILVTVNPMGLDSKEGYLFIFKLNSKADDDKLIWYLDPVFNNLGDPYPWKLGSHSLAAGDSDDNDTLDTLCATAFNYVPVENEIYYDNYLVIWDIEEDGEAYTFTCRPAIPISSSAEGPIYLDVGDVYPSNVGDEIVLLRRDVPTDTLELYSFDGTSLELIKTPTLSEGYFSMVRVADSDEDGQIEIICVGGVPQKAGKKGRATTRSDYYIEVFGLINGNIESEWRTHGGESGRDEAPWDASVG